MNGGDGGLVGDNHPGRVAERLEERVLDRRSLLSCAARTVEEDIPRGKDRLHLGEAEFAEDLRQRCGLHGDATDVDPAEERDFAVVCHDAWAAARWRTAGLMTRWSQLISKRGSKRREQIPHDVWCLGRRMPVESVAVRA